MSEKLILWKNSLSNKISTWKKNVPKTLSSYKKRVLKPKPTDILFLGILLRIVNKLFDDMKPKHNLKTIPLQYWTAILLVFLLASSIPLLWNAKPNLQNNILAYAIMMSFISSILDILEISLDILAYKIVLTFISIFTLISLLKAKGSFSRIYLGLFLLTFFDFLTILYERSIYKDLRIFFEILFVFGVGYYIFKAKFNWKQLAVLTTTAVIVRELSINIYANRLTDDKDLPFLIFSTVFNQLLGSYSVKTDFYGAKITSEMIFVLHFTEFAILIFALYFKRPSLVLLIILMTGFDMTYAPVVGFRAAAIMYQFNRNDTNINQFNLSKRAITEPV